MPRPRLGGIAAVVACGLISAATLAWNTAGLLTIAPASAQPTVTAQTVTTVNTEGGQFRQTGPRAWTENNGMFNFTEVSRDTSSVFLLDEARGVRLQLDIARRVVIYSDAGTQPFVLYRIVSVSAAGGPQPPPVVTTPRPPIVGPQPTPAVTGLNVTQVDTPTGRFRMVGPGAWTEDDGRFNYRETGRDASSVLLFDAQRNARIVLDIARRQVLYADGNAQPVFLMPIANVAAAPVTPLPPITVRPPTPPVGVTPPDPNAAAQTFLAVHNRFRADHCAPPLRWSPAIAAGAQAWAERCVCGHDSADLNRRGEGENVACGHATAEAAVTGWYSEISAYNFNNPGFQPGTGHFTAVVWRGSSEIGCGFTTRCANLAPGQVHWVCRYKAPGNFTGEFPRNVLPKRPACNAAR